jgi:hypothetical protein
MSLPAAQLVVWFPRSTCIKLISYVCIAALILLRPVTAQAMALITARTLVLLRGEPLLCRSLVPLLTEALAAAGNPAPVVAAFGTTRAPSSTSAGVNGAGSTSAAFVPGSSTFDVLSQALAAIAAEVAVHQHGSPGDLWAYEQVGYGHAIW